jgi:hypothetical protein
MSCTAVSSQKGHANVQVIGGQALEELSKEFVDYPAGQKLRILMA